MKIKNSMNQVLPPERQHITKQYWIPFYTEAGPLNIMKGLITGWRHMTAHPDAVFRYCNLYNPATVKEIKREGFNAVFVGWSVGFSLEAEKIQREQVTAFASECRRLGIKVLPYLCSITMFQEDMFRAVLAAKQWGQLDHNGRPIYYHDVSRRAIACLRQPGWRRYIKKRIRLAVKSGLDCIYLDNPISRCYCPLCRREFRSYLRQRGEALFNPPDEMQMRGLLSPSGKIIHLDSACMEEILNRGKHGKLARQWLFWSDFTAQGVLDFLSDMARFVHKLNPKTPISCNGGDSPRIFQDMDFVLSETAWFPNFEKDRFRSNMDLMHYHAGDARYVKPVVSLQGQDRSFRADDPRLQRLSLAEGAAFSISICAHQYREFHAPEFTGFFKKHNRLFAGMESVAPLAVIMPHIPGSHLPDPLAEANILYDRILPEYLLKTDLSRYRAIIIDDMPQIASLHLKALIAYLIHGGHIALNRSSGMLDENFNRWPINPFAAFIKKGSVFYSRSTFLRQNRYFLRYTDWGGDNPPPAKKVSQKLIAKLLNWEALARVEMPPSKTVMAQVVRPRGKSGYVIHILNYAPQKAQNLKVRLPFLTGVQKAWLHVPGQESRAIRLERWNNTTCFTIRILDIYAVVEIPK